MNYLLDLFSTPEPSSWIVRVAQYHNLCSFCLLLEISVVDVVSGGIAYLLVVESRLDDLSLEVLDYLDVIVEDGSHEQHTLAFFGEVLDQEIDQIED